MEDKGFDINKDFDMLLERLIRLNGKEKVDRQAQAMKVAYVMAIARMAMITEKFDNCSWEETEAIKEDIRTQVAEWLDSNEEDVEIGNMLAEVNQEIEKESMDKFFVKAYKFASDMVLLVGFTFIVIGILYLFQLIK